MDVDKVDLSHHWIGYTSIDVSTSMQQVLISHVLTQTYCELKAAILTNK